MENKFDTGDLFTNEENHWGKTPPGDFKVTTPKNLLLSITCDYKYKESYQFLLAYPEILTYSWTLTPLLNWTCIVVAIFPLMHESQYMTNQCAQILVRD